MLFAFVLVSQFSLLCSGSSAPTAKQETDASKISKIKSQMIHAISNITFEG
jgi:hypothetical protein